MSGLPSTMPRPAEPHKKLARRGAAGPGVLAEFSNIPFLTAADDATVTTAMPVDGAVIFRLTVGAADERGRCPRPAVCGLELEQFLIAELILL